MDLKLACECVYSLNLWSLMDILIGCSLIIWLRMYFQKLNSIDIEAALMFSFLQSKSTSSSQGSHVVTSTMSGSHVLR